jgi:hypothetical protein
MERQRPIQPRDCRSLIANACESGIRPPSRATHPVPGQASAGNAFELHPKGTHPAVVVVGMESRAAPSGAIAGRASERRCGQPRCEGTHPNAVAGNACGRQHGWQVITHLWGGAAQPAHAARRRSGDRDRADCARYHAMKALPIYSAARLMRHALGGHEQLICGEASA